MWLLLLFIGIPLIEIALFIQVGGWLTLWPTLGIVIATAVLGSVLVRRQGARAIADLGRSLEELRDPARPLAEGAMILVAGVLLVTPGFFTDAVGFALLVPGIRSLLIRRISERIVTVRHTSRGQGPSAPGHDDPIDAEYRDVTPENTGRTARNRQDRDRIGRDD